MLKDNWREEYTEKGIDFCLDEISELDDDLRIATEALRKIYDNPSVRHVNDAEDVACEALRLITR